jgi:hypothetical protein
MTLRKIMTLRERVCVIPTDWARCIENRGKITVRRIFDAGAARRNKALGVVWKTKV